MIELKPCPFCRGQATSIVKDFHPIGLRYGAACVKCDCWCDFRCKTEEEAATRWNTRYDPSPQSAVRSPRWIVDIRTSELFERQPDNSYRAAYTIAPVNRK